jgi:hypothetical protein
VLRVRVSSSTNSERKLMTETTHDIGQEEGGLDAILVRP